MAYSWNGNVSYLNASLTAFKMLDRFDVQVHGVNSAQEARVGPAWRAKRCPTARARQNGTLGLLGSGWAGQVVALTAENVMSSRRRDGSGDIFGARARSCVFMAVGGAQRAQSLNCSQTATR